MDSFSIALWASAGLVVLVLAGVRVAFAAAFAGFAGLCAIFIGKRGWADGVLIAVEIAGAIPHSKSTTYALSLIPVFILIGFFAHYAGLTRHVFDAAKKWVGWLPGGLGVATVFATAGFAAVSGASAATAAIFARVAIPEMLAARYDKRFAAGVVAAGGTLASLIPPSAILVIYAIITEQSVGHLLLAGFLPGAVSALVYAALVVFLACRDKGLGPPVSGFSWRERFLSLPPTAPVFAVIFIILYAVYFGWATPTEAGALGAVVVAAMAARRGMRRADVRDALMETAKLTAMIFAMIWGVLILCPLVGLRRFARRFRAIRGRIGAAAHRHFADDSRRLRGFGDVYGRHRDDGFDFAGGFSGRRRFGLRSDLVRDYRRQNGGIVLDYPADRIELLRRRRSAPRTFRCTMCFAA